MYIYIMRNFIMSKESINKSNLKEKKVWGIFLPLVSTTNHQVSETLQQWEYLNLRNGEKIWKNEVKEWAEEACNDIIEKYWFSDNQWNIFKERLSIKYNNTKTWWLRWTSYYWWTKITKDWTLRLPDCIISLNPNLIENKKFYKAILIHEIDHWAFRLKKFFNSKLWHTNPSNRHEREIAANEYNNLLNSATYTFSTELLARVDTSDILASKNWEYSRDEIDRFGIWNEDETTWEPGYTDGIKYAKKIFDFQKRLYNVVWNKFGRDSSKPKNKQLSKEAEEEFEDIMTHLRNIVFNCCIKSTEKVIDAVCDNFEKATKRDQFKSSISRIYSDITR